MITVERKVNNIIQTMNARVANGEPYPHLKAFADIGRLALSRLFASARLKRVNKFNCNLCTKHRPHTHEYILFGVTDIEPFKVTDYKHLQNVLNRDLYGMFKVSSPRFGRTVNIKYVGSVDDFERTLALRYYLQVVCGLTLLNNKAVQRKVCAVVKI